MPAVKKRTPRKKRATATKRASAMKPASAKKPATKKRTAPSQPIDRIREICLALPEAHEVEAWGTPTFRVKNKVFAMYSAGGHTAGRAGLWIMSVSTEQDFVLRARPDKYFKPPYVGPSGWIGAWLDKSPPWAEIAELIRDAYRRRAPKKLAALVD